MNCPECGIWIDPDELEDGRTLCPECDAELIFDYEDEYWDEDEDEEEEDEDDMY